MIAWAAAQPWSNGKVGMTGISWGGFNALQVAARRPPALKAIITLCASDDRYADDIHHMGGALLTEQEMWSNFMLVKKAMPPDPQIVGSAGAKCGRSGGRPTVRCRRSGSPISGATTTGRQGSVIEDYAAIECAVMAVCGWEDSYSNFVPRLLAGLTGPRLGIVGPWSHAYPCRGAPGPLIGYLQEALRWWRHWLDGRGRPASWRSRSTASGSAARSGRSPSTSRPCRLLGGGGKLAVAADRATEVHLNADGLLGMRRVDGAARSVRSPATAGRDCGRWGGYGGRCPDMPIDQRREDGQGLCFETAPLGEDTALLGAVELDLEVRVDQPHVNLTARLCDVYPDGTSALMTYGVLNLRHRDSHEIPRPARSERRSACGCSSTISAARSRRATASASASPPSIGRSSGRSRSW